MLTAKIFSQELSIDKKLWEITNYLGDLYRFLQRMPLSLSLTALIYTCHGSALNKVY